MPWRRKWQTQASLLAWKIPWTEEPGGLQSTGSQRLRQDLAAKQQRELPYNVVLISGVMAEGFSYKTYNSSPLFLVLLFMCICSWPICLNYLTFSSSIKQEIKNNHFTMFLKGFRKCMWPHRAEFLTQSRHPMNTKFIISYKSIYSFILEKF